MSSNRIRIELKEKPELRGIPLKVFLDSIKTTFRLLHIVESEVTRDFNHRLQWVVVNLEMGSNIVEIEGKPLGKTPPNIAKEVVNQFQKSIASVEQSDDPKEALSIDVLMTLQQFKKVLRNNLAHVNFVSNGTTVTATTQLQRNVESLLLSESTVIGSVDGNLDAINLHEGFKFFIYPLIGPSRIECVFNPSLLDDVKDLLKQYVNVSGELHYAKRQKFPHKINVRKITKHPSQDNLPSWEDVRGIAPEITKGMAISDFIRDIRNRG